MSTRGWITKEILGPRGMWSAVALIGKGNPQRAVLAQNVRFSPKECVARPGTSTALAVSGKTTGMYDWLSPSDHLFIYQAGTSIKRYRFADATTLDLLTGLSTTRAPVFAELGYWIYFCGFDTSGNGTFQVRLHDGLITGGVPDVDKAFRGPLQVNSFTASDGGTGLCTKGMHKIGFIFQSRSGFSGKPGPVNGSNIFSPTSVTLNAGNRTISVSLNLNTPTDSGTGPGGVSAGIYPIMTRADNPDKWFFIPDPNTGSELFIQLPYNTAAWPVFFQISVSDDSLADDATEAGDYFDLMTQDGSGSGPFNPSFVVAYGRRMVYGVGTILWISEIDDPQRLNAAFNFTEMPNKRKALAGFPLGQDFFVGGDKWTAVTSDNGDLPSTWPQAKIVSDSLGIRFQNCVEWRTAGQYAWVANESGCYVFSGTYPNRPITYYVSDYWGRINWAAGYAIQIKDDTVALRCSIAVPLDGATEPTHVFVIDYTNGITYETCDISIDTFGFGAFSSIALVRDNATLRTALWIGPTAAGNIAKLDNSTDNDMGSTVVHPIWESGYVRGGNEIQAMMVRCGYADLWIRGSGTLIHQWKGLDGVLVVTPVVMGEGSTITALSASPGIELQAAGDLSPVENFTLRFETNALNAWFALSGSRVYMKPSMWKR